MGFPIGGFFMRWIFLLITTSALGYSVGGSITGLDGYLVLRLNNAYTQILLPNATQYQFTNSLTAGSVYAVTVGIQPIGSRCTVRPWLGKSDIDVIANVTCVKVTSATLNWTMPTKNTDGTDLTDLKGYVVYYGTDPTLKSAASRLIPSGSILTTTIQNLTVGQTYYFAVASVSASGIGPRSNIASK